MHLQIQLRYILINGIIPFLYGRRLMVARKICPSCGRAFNCGGLLFCWCDTVKIDRATLAEIGETYHGCLCQECLENY
jgi:hypothetical protein